MPRELLGYSPEDLAQSPYARFMKDENLERLERLRQTYDPAGRFRSWMGLPQHVA